MKTTTTAALLVSLHLLGSMSLHSQEASLHTQVSYSQNRVYHVTVTGYFYEGFVGDQKISLVHATGDTLWSKTLPRRFLILPAVSNNGDVAITHRDIRIYDKTERLKGTLALKPLESPYNVGDYQGTVHGFSPDGTRYFIMMGNGPSRDVQLVCLSDSAKMIWSKNLGYFTPNEILFYDGKFVTHDCGHAGVGYKNRCLVMDLMGNSLWQYETHSRTGRDWDVSLDFQSGSLLLVDKSLKLVVDLDTVGVHRN